MTASLRSNRSEVSLEAPVAEVAPRRTRDRRLLPHREFDRVARSLDESVADLPPVVECHAAGRPAGLRFRLGVKRALDLVVALLAVVVLSPVLLVVAVLILVYDGRPVFFRQTRVGRDGHRFTMIKFRSMRHRRSVSTVEVMLLPLADVEGVTASANHREGPFFKDRDDPRVHRFGRFLRRTSIDELPQLFNVVGGSMSLVGPRPALPSEVREFPPEFRARESMPQGMTGAWQLESRDDPSFQQIIDLDLAYVGGWSLRRDLWLLLRTPFVVVRQALRGTAA